MFAKYIICADFQGRGLPMVLHILRLMADRREGINTAIGPQGCSPLEHNMGEQSRSVADFDIGPHNAIGTDFDAVAYLCRCVYDRGGVYLGH
jgi:hypothetical protein